jgi:hypothetical protein
MTKLGEMYSPTGLNGHGIYIECKTCYSKFKNSDDKISLETMCKFNFHLDTGLCAHPTEGKNYTHIRGHSFI